MEDLQAFTNRNHYNPCFWTALWNKSYYSQYCSQPAGRANTGSARDQIVYALNMRAGKILQTTVERVHLHKNLGVAEIRPESMMRFCARWRPDRYDELAAYVATNPEVLYLDFEDILTGMEKTAGYDSVMQAAKVGDLESVEHKGFLTCALFLHAMRSFEFMSIAVDKMNAVGVDKWEYFWLLKRAWGNPDFLARALVVAAFSEWTLWRTPDHRFPLCDSPVMISRDSLMAVLSPTLLLDINLNKRCPEEYWCRHDELPAQKYAEFRQRCITNTFKEIIFHDPSVLEQWRASPEAVTHIATLRDPSARRAHLDQAAAQIMFALDGFGRLSNGVEQWLQDNCGSAGK